ncbi:MAG: hypothetical protein L6R39_001298 [Caloplaca ligustica]|nr:MAG: hypothetical protein L6R39_001298 [Caloplaca ligustica]
MTKRSISHAEIRCDRPEQHKDSTDPSSSTTFKGRAPGRFQTLDFQGSGMNNTNGPENADESITPSSTSSSQERLLGVLKDETDSLLRTHMTPTSSNFVSDTGFPLGVEKAKVEYDQGLLSNGVFFRDCLPPTPLCLKVGAPSVPGADLHDPQAARPRASENPVPAANHPEQGNNGELSSVVRPWNLPREAQLRRINQVPLSAIHEEPDSSAGAQHGCLCNVCKDMPQGKGIVWFHLCPRYLALAQKNGIKYEPYEGRVILHYGNDRSSIGLIIEGPMEDRLIPAAEPVPVAETSSPKKVRAPRPAKLDPRSMHSAAGRINKAAAPNASPIKPAPVQTPALRRPISPTGISRPSPLDPLSNVYHPKSAKSNSSPTPAENKGLDESPCPVLIDSEEDIHPALRVGGVQPQEWSTPPTRSHSEASLFDGSPHPPQSACSGKVRLSLGSSEFSGEHPARKDSLGAPTHPGLVEPSNHGHSRHQSKPHPLFQVDLARHIPDCDASEPLLSPSAGPEQTPSEYLCPSTASSLSYNRSSTSSYGETLPQHVYRARKRTVTAAAERGEVENPFRESEVIVKNANTPQNPSPSSQQSYHTAQNGHCEPSPALPMPLTARTAPSTALDGLCRNTQIQESPYFPIRRYHRPQASKQSTAQSLNGLRFQRQRASDLVSGTTLLNGTAFDSADETSHSQAGKAEDRRPESGQQQRPSYHRPGSNTYSTDSPVIAGAAEARRANIIASGTSLRGTGARKPLSTANLLQTAGASEAYRTDNVTSASDTQHATRRASVPLGQGIAATNISPHSLTSSRVNNISSGINTRPNTRPNSEANQELESYISSVQSSRLPPRASLLIQQNLCSHIKLQDVLGMDSCNSCAFPATSSYPSARMVYQQHPHSRKLQSTGMLNAFAADGRLVRKDEPGFKKLKKKSSQFIQQVKAGFRAPRGEEWLDSDDGRH